MYEIDINIKSLDGPLNEEELFLLLETFRGQYLRGQNQGGGRGHGDRNRVEFFVKNY